MRSGKLVFVVFLVVMLVSVPVVADAHWRFPGGLVLGLGLGFLTGYTVAPRPVYAAPPVYYYPPPAVVYPYQPTYVPAPLPPPGPVGSNDAVVTQPVPPPAGSPACREWTMTARHWEKRWDPNYGVWRTVLVERWGWVGVPCRN